MRVLSLALTRVVVDHVLQTLKGKPWGDVVPAISQTEYFIVLYGPVSHRE